MIERYSLPPMKDLWTEDAQYRRWLEVELAVIEVYEETGDAPPGTAGRVRMGARIDVARIAEIEAETDHDVIAFIKAVTEPLGDEARWFHKGLTSSDVVDTALSLALKRAGELVSGELEALRDALREAALRHRDTITVGRTHGIHAEPTSLGLKFLSFMAETDRNIARLATAIEGIAVGKLSGAVGNNANIAPDVEARALAKLGLDVSRVSTQVVPRDHHAEYVNALALAGAGIERIALEVRHLQRTEVREASEPFRRGQRGSSAMPHKKNPILCERLCGMARLLRAHAGAALEDIALWHERDISHSSVERVILPDATLVAFYMARKAAGLVRNLVVWPERMRRNVSGSHNLVYSQRVLLALVERGMSREEAYKLVQEHALAAWEREADFRDLLLGDARVVGAMPRAELEALFDPAPFLAHVGAIYARFGLGAALAPGDKPQGR